MENGSIRRPDRDVNSRPGAACTLAVAALALGAISTALVAQEEPLDVTLQVLDDVSTIEGVLMPLEEEPEHGANADSPPSAENPPPEAVKEEDRSYPRMFGLLRNRRRRQVLARAAIPDALWTATIDAAPALARLDAASEKRLRDLALLFLHEKRFEAAGGLVLDDAMKVRIAALACLLVLELGLDSYSGFVSVIVYPDEFLVRDREYVDDDGVVHSSDDVLSGEAWEQGPVILAWKEIEASGQGDGYNVVAHEFAHKLDLLDGSFDGMPPLHTEMRSKDWIAAFQSAYDDLRARVERDEDTWLDPYAAEEPAEFFAVCTEMFFDVPEEFQAEYPALYAQLSAFYKQDPARAA